MKNHGSPPALASKHEVKKERVGRLYFTSANERALTPKMPSKSSLATVVALAITYRGIAFNPMSSAGARSSWKVLK